MIATRPPAWRQALTGPSPIGPNPMSTYQRTKPPITVADALAALQFATAADPEQRKVLRKALLAALSALEEDEDR